MKGQHRELYFEAFMDVIPGRSQTPPPLSPHPRSAVALSVM